MKKIIFSTLISLLSLIFFYSLHQTGQFESLEMQTFDSRMRWSESNMKANQDVVMILIDEASLQSMKPLVGRWPWPRSLYADLIDFLAASGARSIIFDILFTEPQDPRDENGMLGENDAVFAEISSASENTIHAAQFITDFSTHNNQTQNPAPLPDDYVEKFSLKNLTLEPNLNISKSREYYLPIQELYQSAASMGIVEFLPDADGVYRRTHLIRQLDQNYFPVLSTAFLFNQQPGSSIHMSRNFLSFNQHRVPLQKDQTYLVNMKKEFNTYSIGGVFSSIQKIMNGETENLLVSPDDFADKVILIGASAVGVDDLKHTSTGLDVPGVYLHGSIISNILEDDYITTLPSWIELLFVLIGSLFICFMVFRFSKLFIQISVPGLLILVYIFTGYQLFDSNRILLSFVFPLSSWGFTWLGSFTYLFMTEGQDRRKTRKMLAQYVSPAVLTEVMDNENALTPQVGSKENLSILFSDIRGFTNFSESTEPEQVVEMLNFYLSEMVEIVFEYHGTIDKFIGDAVMAFWGAPVKTDNHPIQSVNAALAMRKGLKKVNLAFEKKNRPPFQIGIGVHTGQVILGNIGSEKKLDYTIIGDNVNLASRIEGLTKTYGCDILISEITEKEVRSEIICQIVDAVKVKGKQHPILLYYPLCRLNEDSGITAAAHTKATKAAAAFQFYKKRRWDQAKEVYNELLTDYPEEKVFKMFLERCSEYQTTPPEEDWDGSYQMLTK